MAEAIDPAKANVRLPMTNIPDEIKPLVKAMNVALDRLDEGLKHQREFNADAAHQLRTPLAVLSTNIETMTDKKVAAKLQYDVELMTRIVSQLLLVARLDAQSISFDDRVDLNIAATNVASNLGPLAIASGKHLAVEQNQLPVFVRCNAQALTAALSNLIENAIMHTPPQTTVVVNVTEDPGVEVVDTGKGIPAAHRDQIFERFWKGDRQGKGAGLGLSIVKRTMSALRGTVSVSEAPGGGAAFKLIFPQQI
jgi:signal transduction histidine kinase